MEAIHHKPCEDCGSSDGLSIYEDHTYCFVCSKHTWTKNKEREVVVEEYQAQPRDPLRLTESGLTKTLKDRGGIDHTVCTKYGVFVEEVNGEVTKHFYPYYSANGKHIANKVREVATKKFYSEGNLHKGMLFGQQVFPAGKDKIITITEGECDAMACYEMLGKTVPVVSIKDGSTSAYNNIKAQLEYLNSFDKVIICFDNDDPGRAATASVLDLFAPGKCHYMKLDQGLKDANDYFKATMVDRFRELWSKAEKYTPAEIVSSSRMIDALMDNNSIEPLIPLPYSGLNDKLFGIKPTELMLVTAETGVGKSQVMKQLIWHIRTNQPDAKIGVIFLEETPVRAATFIAGLEMRKRLNLPDVALLVDQEEKKKALDKMFGDDKIFFYDNWSDNDVDRIMNRIRYMVKGLDCKYIFLDHISQITMDASINNQINERQILDTVTNKLKALTIETRVPIIAVTHLNRNGDIRGSAGIEKLVDTILLLERDTMSDDESVATTTRIIIKKNRLGDGRLGLGATVIFDPETGHMVEATPDTTLLLPTDSIGASRSW